ncbi:acyl-CoA dehydrogenase family protein [Phenylobacterium sp.]|uniref:acyl-CoA dehydrogenase family protein n=1 Tax=Phenylobacterium sp. TaxID=1871053 RepID=UPI002F402311
MAQRDSEHLDGEDQHEFRLRARAWMAERLPPRLPEEPILDWDDPELVAKDRRIQRALFDGGLAGITIPKEYGGQGLDARYERIFLEEAQPYRLPWAFGVAFNVVVPTLLAHGSEYVQRRYIPAVLRGDEVWCQMLSEPSGGSDLAGLLTRATRTADGWALNGSKVWTTGGNVADMAICLARTDPDVPKHAGLTLFAVSMHAPGLTVTPLKLLDGGGDFCQEFLDDVAISDDDVIGEVNGGWLVATTLMVNERAGVGRGWHIGLGRAATAQHLELATGLMELVREAGRANDSHARQLVGEAWVLDAVQTLTTKRIGAGLRSGAIPGASAALLKLMGGKIAARRTALVSELAGPQGVAAPAAAGGPRTGLLRVMTHSIGGGTAEMQSNAVAERLLGLPRDATFDREMPFNQLRHNTAPAYQRD